MTLKAFATNSLLRLFTVLLCVCGSAQNTAWAKTPNPDQSKSQKKQSAKRKKTKTPPASDSKANPPASPIITPTPVAASPTPPVAVIPSPAAPSPKNLEAEADVIRINGFGPQPDHHRLQFVEAGESIYSVNGNVSKQFAAGMRTVQFPKLNNVEKDVEFFNTSYGIEFGDQSGLYADLAYLALHKTSPLGSVGLFRYVEFATGYGITAETRIAEGQKTSWEVGVDLTGQMFFSKALSVGPIVTLENSSRLGWAAKASTSARYTTKNLMIYAEFGGRSPFDRSQAEAILDFSVDALVTQVGEMSIYAGGQVSNKDLKRYNEGQWWPDESLRQKNTAIKARVSVVF